MNKIAINRINDMLIRTAANNSLSDNANVLAFQSKDKNDPISLLSDYLKNPAISNANIEFYVVGTSPIHFRVVNDDEILFDLKEENRIESNVYQNIGMTNIENNLLDISKIEKTSISVNDFKNIYSKNINAISDNRVLKKTNDSSDNSVYSYIQQNFSEEAIKSKLAIQNFLNKSENDNNIPEIKKTNKVKRTI